MSQKDNTALTEKVPRLDVSLTKISALLARQEKTRTHRQKYAPVKEVLALLGKGLVLSAAILAPTSAKILIPLVSSSPDWEEWKHYNISYLQRTLRRLERQRVVEIVYKNGQEILKLTTNGKQKIFKYTIDSLVIDRPDHWDNKWRLVLYDIPTKQKQLSRRIRETLHSFGFYAIQESVYIFPYPCFDQIEFMREFYRLGDKIQYMLVEKIERDEAFKTYFNLS